MQTDWKGIYHSLICFSIMDVDGSIRAHNALCTKSLN